MRKSWWKKESELDNAQKKAVGLPRDGRYLLIGPPGSGKTNLLLLRAMFLSSAGLKDILFVTVGRSLQEFIVTGIGTNGLLDTKQIQTYRAWTMRHLAEHSPKFMKNPPTGDYDAKRSAYVAELERVNSKLSAIYNAILVDEAQDLSDLEFRTLIRLTKRMMVAGDDRQQILAGGEGIETATELGFTEIPLELHYRIGRRICEVADSVLPPKDGAKPLLQTCNYDEKAMPSTATLNIADSFESQLANVLKNIRVQLRAFPDEAIGVLLPRNNLFPEVRNFFESSDIADLVAFHEQQGERQFSEEKRIYVTVIHSAKGTEFRAVHILRAELLRNRKLAFTAFTRAKTSLVVHYTGRISKFIEGAFAVPSTPKISELFS